MMDYPLTRTFGAVVIFAAIVISIMSISKSLSLSKVEIHADFEVKELELKLAEKWNPGRIVASSIGLQGTCEPLILPAAGAGEALRYTLGFHTDIPLNSKIRILVSNTSVEVRISGFGGSCNKVDPPDAWLSSTDVSDDNNPRLIVNARDRPLRFKDTVTIRFDVSEKNIAGIRPLSIKSLNFERTKARGLNDRVSKVMEKISAIQTGEINLVGFPGSKIVLGEGESLRLEDVDGIITNILFGVDILKIGLVARIGEIQQQSILLDNTETIDRMPTYYDWLIIQDRFQASISIIAFIISLIGVMELGLFRKKYSKYAADDKSASSTSVEGADIAQEAPTQKKSQILGKSNDPKKNKNEYIDIDSRNSIHDPFDESK